MKKEKRNVKEYDLKMKRKEVRDAVAEHSGKQSSNAFVQRARAI